MEYIIYTATVVAIVCSLLVLRDWFTQLLVLILGETDGSTDSE